MHKSVLSLFLHITDLAGRLSLATGYHMVGAHTDWLDPALCAELGSGWDFIKEERVGRGAMVRRRHTSVQLFATAHPQGVRSRYTRTNQSLENYALSLNDRVVCAQYENLCPRIFFCLRPKRMRIASQPMRFALEIDTSPIGCLFLHPKKFAMGTIEVASAKKGYFFVRPPVGNSLRIFCGLKQLEGEIKRCRVTCFWFALSAACRKATRKWKMIAQPLRSGMFVDIFKFI